MADTNPIVKRIVVGSDGSDNAAVALRWAAEEATLHDARLEALYVWNLLDQRHADPSVTFDPAYNDDAARAVLATWVDDALGNGAAVEQRVVNDLPPRALLEAGDAADLLVVGARGTGGFEGLLVGSVADRVAQQASRPVAVIRNPAPVAGGRVVVGIDGSARSLGALRWAAAEARARDADLDVLHAWRLPPMTLPPMMTFPDLTVLEQVGRDTLDKALADPALEGTRVRPHLTNRSASEAIMDLAEDAGLVVVGTRGLGRVTGTLLGSVSRQLLHHSPAPVVVL